jgi:CO/xanthine dehydrogenase Mo-binding subunit
MAQTVDRSAEYAQYKAVGKSVVRQDAPAKVTGRARYAGDVPVAGRLLYAHLVLSPYAHARIVNIDPAPALAVPGVKAVYTAETLPLEQYDAGSRTRSPLARREVLWAGHPVALVLAESEAAAEDGAAAVDVDYEPLPAVLDPLTAMEPGSPTARLFEKEQASEIAGGGAHAAVSEEEVQDEQEARRFSENVTDKTHLRSGDIESGWREAEVVVERRYQTSVVHQSYLEPQSITVAPSPDGSHYTVWASVQGLFEARSVIADTLALPERRIHVESVPIGGAFGGKFTLLEPLAVAAARASRRPVRLVLTRSQDLLAANPAPQGIITVKLGARRDGTLVALQGEVIFDTGAYAGAAVGLAAFILASTYRCPHIDIRGYEVLTNKVGVGAYRAPGAPQATFALESTVDELCRALGMDPLEFRLKNCLKEGDPSLDRRRPHWPRIGLQACLEKVRQHPFWIRRAELPALPDELRGWKVGVGVAVGGWPGGAEPAAAACRLERDGSLTVVVGTVDLTGTDASLALIAAEGLGVSPALVHVAHDNSDTVPYSGSTGGSKTTYTMGPAVLAAARDARQQILEIAADLLEAAIDDLTIEGDRVVVRGVPDRHVPLERIGQVSTAFGSRYQPVYGRGRSALSASPMYAAHVARVAVDPETGEVRVLDYLAAQDVGFAINPAEVEGQIHGGVTQGLGWALFEGFVYDDQGQLLTATLMDYALPHSTDVPNITPVIVEVPSDHGPFGAKGVGEPPVVPVAAAVANAIRDAVGVRLTQLPMTAERVLQALQAHR